MNHDELQDLIKRLRDLAKIDGCQTSLEAAKELEDQLLLIEKQQKIIRRIYAEQLPDTWFVCGELGEKDQNNLPKYIEVCPAYGVDWSQIYERTDRTIGGMGN